MIDFLWEHGYIPMILMADIAISIIAVLVWLDRIIN